MLRCRREFCRNAFGGDEHSGSLGLAGEFPAFSGVDRPIWNDRALLHSCEFFQCCGDRMLAIYRPEQVTLGSEHGSLALVVAFKRACGHSIPMAASYASGLVGEPGLFRGIAGTASVLLQSQAAGDYIQIWR